MSETKQILPIDVYRQAKKNGLTKLKATKVLKQLFNLTSSAIEKIADEVEIKPSKLKQQPLLTTATHAVICYNWTEYDEGVQRDDGYSIHVDVAEAEKYLKRYLADRVGTTKTPAYYCQPSGIPFEVQITSTDYKKLVKAGGSVRLSSDNAPMTLNLLTIKWGGP